ncbi:kinase-like domain-containing protein [Phycomyces blakesleeanus]|uniref:Kinase-like domain-containing protein n=1 Tax=Phycomyces blakesleeanus TaxID=4837 RepID=A0ABR3B2M5_PHYBL
MNATTSLRRTRRENWQADFYKNGYPKDVIVIDDSPPPMAIQSQQQPSQPMTKTQTHKRPPPDTHPSGIIDGITTSSSSSSSSSTTTNTTTNTATSGQTHLTNLATRRPAILTADPSALYYTGPPAASTRSKRSRKDQDQDQDQDQETETINQSLHPQPATAPAPAQASAQAPAPAVRNLFDDKDGHYIINPNESLTVRYKMMRLLGQGTFGKVIECYDRVRREHCAIKIIRAIPKYREASKVEIRVLNTLKAKDPFNSNQCIHLIDWFDYNNHICMVFELLGQSIFDFLKSNEFRPFPPHQIQHFAKQLLNSVAFIHNLKLIHTDLKPENILLVNNSSSLTLCNGHRDPNTKSRILQDTSIRLIDFGSATFEQDYHSSVVSTRHYRAPEIILGMGWSYPCDIWSVGCILVEFFTGDALFQTHENLEHLAMMEAVLGKVPLRISRNASREPQKYFDNGKLRYPTNETSRQSQKYVRALRPLREIIVPSTTLTRNFLDLVSKMLAYDPNERITASEALKHPFFQLDFDQYSRELKGG